MDQDLERPAAVLSDPGFRRLLDDPRSRSQVRALLAERAPHGCARITAPDEPGEAFVLAGRVLDERGQPLPGARVALYHTKADGWYAESTLASDNPRLFGSVLADRAGRWRVRTIQPASYAEGGGAAHVHCRVEAEGCAPLTAGIFFEGDPQLSDADQKEILGEGGTIAPRKPNAEGVMTALVDFRLKGGG